MPDWGTMFGLDAPLLETLLRGTIVFLAVFALMRVVGQRESGGLGISDILIVVLVGSAVTGGLAGGSESVTDGILLVATVLAWSLAIDALAYRFPRLATILKSRPRPLVQDGETNRSALRRELMSEEELAAQLRLHGITSLDDVARAYLEPNGMISVIRRDAGEPDEPLRPAVG